MNHKIISLVLVLVGLFSIQAFSQAPEPEKSNHPLLDKYYPQKQQADSAVVIPPATRQTPDLKTAPVLSPTSQRSTLPANIQVPQTSTVPEKVQVAATPAVSPGLDSLVVSKQVAPAVSLPAKPPLQAQPGAPIYRDTRLGSSSPLYDTYEKNNDGAGSVTTKPKR